MTNGDATCYSTGQIAELCKVSVRTVSNWIDSGRLKGFRIPLGTDRRVLRNDLAEFLRDNGLPFSVVVKRRILVVTPDATLGGELASSSTMDCEFRIVRTLFCAGYEMFAAPPDALLMDARLGRNELMETVVSLRRSYQHKSTLIVALANEDDSDTDGLIVSGFNACLKRPCSVAALLELMR